MKYYIYTVLLLLLTASCSDDVQKWDQWPEWKLASPLSVGGQVLDEEIYSNFQGKKLHLEKGQEVEFSGIDEIESILSPDYFEYVSENKARFKKYSFTFYPFFIFQNALLTFYNSFQYFYRLHYLKTSNMANYRFFCVSQYTDNTIHDSYNFS